MVDKFRWVWTHLAWLVAAIVIMVDPRHVYEWAHQHQPWSEILVAIWALLLAWAQKQKQVPPVTGAETLPPGTGAAPPSYNAQQGRARR